MKASWSKKEYPKGHREIIGDTLFVEGHAAAKVWMSAPKGDDIEVVMKDGSTVRGKCNGVDYKGMQYIGEYGASKKVSIADMDYVVYRYTEYKEYDAVKKESVPTDHAFKVVIGKEYACDDMATMEDVAEKI